MKKIFLSALALIGLGTIIPTAADAQMYIIKDGKVKVALDYTPDYITFDNPMLCGGVVGEAVDMGLSVKWSSVNVGASNPQDAGNYYAWGEVDTKEDYSWDTYRYMKSGKSDRYNINKYQVEDHEFGGIWYKDAKYHNNGGKTVLDKADDAASANWGGGWVMPTQADWEELKSQCDIQWTSNYNNTNKAGYVVTSKASGNTNSIFLPAAGSRHGSGEPDSVGDDGYYWSSSLGGGSSYYAYYLSFHSGGFNPWVDYYRYDGYSVRPVCPAQGNTNGHVAVDLGLTSGKLWASCNVGASSPEGSGDYFV